jgi:hypothetical protein
MSADPLLAAALEYASHGVPVFPLRGKPPALAKAQGGRGLHDATTDPAVVRRMWARFPGANVGVRTGALEQGGPGWSVLDVDGDTGRDSLRVIEQAGRLPRRTAVSVTGSGGLHIAYRHRDGLGLRNSQGILGAGLDVRGDGGYIVAPPSVHPATGALYEWETMLRPWGDIPAWPEGQLAVTRPPGTVVRDPAAIAWLTGAGADRVLAGLLSVVAKAQPGSRNAALYWSAAKAREHIAAGRLDLATVRGALTEAGLSIGLPPDEIARTLSSALRKATAA